jgi:hypothetical protein
MFLATKHSAEQRPARRPGDAASVATFGSFGTLAAILAGMGKRLPKRGSHFKEEENDGKPL